MDEKIRTALGDEILMELESLAAMQPGSEQQKAAVENVAKLYRLGIDEVRADSEWEDLAVRKMQIAGEKDARKAQEQAEAKDRWIKLGMDAAKLVLPMVFYAAWMKKGFQFEETGTFTSATFRGLFSRFRPTER